MTTPDQLSGWATRILDSLDETGITVARTVTWLQNSLYKLNLAIGSGFYTETGSIYPDMIPNVSGIYEEIYYCDYWNKKANANLGAHSYDWTEIKGEEQGTIRRVSKNEVAKTYRLMSQDCQARLAELIQWYQTQDANLTWASQVLYGDRGSVTDFGLLNFNAPPTHFYSDLNTIWINE